MQVSWRVDSHIGQLVAHWSAIVLRLSLSLGVLINTTCTSVGIQVEYIFTWRLLCRVPVWLFSKFPRVQAKFKSGIASRMQSGSQLDIRLACQMSSRHQKSSTKTGVRLCLKVELKKFQCEFDFLNAFPPLYEINSKSKHGQGCGVKVILAAAVRI